MNAEYCRRAFVIMPFSKTQSCTQEEWTEIFVNVFKPAFEDYGYACQRASPTTGSLIKSILAELRYSRLVLADITDRNPNVFYELGVRHALSKRTIIATQHPEHIPSDLRGYWSLVYGTSPGKVTHFKGEIARIMAEIEEDPEKSDSPVSDFLEHEVVGITNFVARENVKRLTALLTESSANINTLREGLSDPRYVSLLAFDCLGLLLNTLYLDVGPDLLRKCYELRHNLMTIKVGARNQEGFIHETINLAGDIVRQTVDVKARLLKGEFIEPSQVSTMLWEPTPPENAENGATPDTVRKYSTSVDMSELDPDELRRHFDNLEL